MNILLIVLLIFLGFDIFLIFKCFGLSNRLISHVGNDFPELYEKFDRPIPGFIRPNPIKAHRLEKYLLTKGPIVYKDNEKVIKLVKRLKKFSHIHYVTWVLLFLTWVFT